MPDTLSAIIEFLGTIAFTISGVYSALIKKLDILGVVIIGFVTAIGGGTLRDVLIGRTPVSWMRDLNTPVLILVTAVITIIFKQKVRNFRVTLFLFDAFGLGLFTVIGLQKGLEAGLHPGVCVALGTITGSFGGVSRDILLNQIPVLFHKEIYATACIVGGIIYFLSLQLFGQAIAEITAVLTVSSIRIIAYQRKWQLPSI